MNTGRVWFSVIPPSQNPRWKIIENIISPWQTTVVFYFFLFSLFFFVSRRVKRFHLSKWLVLSSGRDSKNDWKDVPGLSDNRRCFMYIIYIYMNAYDTYTYIVLHKTHREIYFFNNFFYQPSLSWHEFFIPQCRLSCRWQLRNRRHYDFHHPSTICNLILDYRFFYFFFNNNCICCWGDVKIIFCQIHTDGYIYGVKDAGILRRKKKNS